MNSEPSRWKTGTVSTTVAMATPITTQRRRTAISTTGRYNLISTRLMGCVSSGWIFPTRTAFTMRAKKRGRKLNSVAWVKNSRMAGSSVIANTAAMAMEKVLGEGERLKQPSFLRFQGEDGHKRNRDDQQ